MKILITSDWYRPAVNGVVTSVLNLRRELERAGHEVRVLTLSRTGRSFEEDGVSYIGSVNAGVFYPGARLRTALGGKWMRALMEWGPDVVHSQCEFSTFFLAKKLAEALHVPLIHTYHTVYEDYTHYFSPSRRWGRRAVAVFSRYVADRTDCVIAPTEKVRALLAGYGVETPVRVVPTGIDLDRFRRQADQVRLDALRRQLGLRPDRTVLVSVGRLAAEKNVDELLEHMAALDGWPVTLLLVGDGPCRAALERRAAELGVDAVFAGMVPPAQVADYYQLGDLFVSASSSETQGLTYVEALASGLPALCRADPCLEGVVTDGVNGWQYRDSEGFCRLLEGFLAHPDQWQRLSRNAERTAEAFSARRFARRVEEVYREALGRRAPLPALEVSA